MNPVGSRATSHAKPSNAHAGFLGIVLTSVGMVLTFVGTILFLGSLNGRESSSRLENRALLF